MYSYFFLLLLSAGLQVSNGEIVVITTPYLCIAEGMRVERWPTE